MSVLTRIWTDNPVLTKELRVRMRGSRAYWIITGYLALLSFILFMSYSVWYNTSALRGGGFSSGSKVGQYFFYIIIAVQAALVGFITPAITAGAITIEREQRTMEMLEMTRLSRSSIVAGKLLSAISFVALLLTSSLPLTSICFFLGGVSPEQVFYWYLLLFAISFVTATVGLVWSTIARTTAAAVVMTYSTLFAPFILYVGIGVMTGMGGNSANPWNATLVVGLVAGLFGVPVSDLFGLGWTPVAGIVRAWDMRHYYGLTLPIWLAPVLTYALFGLTLAALASARLESFPDRKAGKLRLLVTLFVAQQLFFFYGARFAVFAPGKAGPAAMGAGFSLLFSLAYPIVLILFLVPIFVTGEIRRVEAKSFSQYLLNGWSPHGLRRGRIASGLPFMLLLCAFAIGMYCLSFVLIRQPSAISGGLGGTNRSVFATAGQPTVNPSGTVTFKTPAAPAAAPAQNELADLIHVAISLAVAVCGFAALGLLLSVAIRNRWVSMLLLYVVLLAILIAPSMARSKYVNAETKTAPGITINLYYLNPLMTLSEVTDTPDHFWSDMPLAFGRTPIWRGGIVCWLFVGGISLLAMLPFVKKISSGEPVQYEDLAARM